MEQRSRTPAAVACYARRITHRQVADLYGCTPDFVYSVLAGRTSAPPRFRALLSGLTGLTEEELFPKELVAS